jgi:transcriptional regulator with XRE-family HTH domain
MNEPISRTKLARDVCYGISAAEISRRCRVDIATARRWERGARCPPATSIMILAEDLGCFDPAWKGWRIRDGQLLSPEGWAASPGEILALPLMRAQITSYQRDQRIAKAEYDALEEQPEPGADLKQFAERALRG